MIATIDRILSQRDFTTAEKQYPLLVDELTKAEQAINDYATAHPASMHSFAEGLYSRNIYSAAIIKGHSFLMLLANFLTHRTSSQVTFESWEAHYSRYVNSVQAAGQSILDSIPFTLGSMASTKDTSSKVLFNTMRMIWPVKSVYLSGASLPEQRDQAYMALLFMGEEVGVKQALSPFGAATTLPVESLRPIYSWLDVDVLPPFTFDDFQPLSTPLIAVN